MADWTDLTVFWRNFILRMESKDGLLLGIFERRAVVSCLSSGLYFPGNGGIFPLMIFIMRPFMSLASKACFSDIISKRMHPKDHRSDL